MRNIKLLTVLFFLSQFLFSQEREKIDGVAAVIGDFVVLESDIDKQFTQLRVSGVSMENASYMESGNNDVLLTEEENIETNISIKDEEEYTPKLFLEENNSVAENDLGEVEVNDIEDYDYEIEKGNMKVVYNDNKENDYANNINC